MRLDEVAVWAGLVSEMSRIGTRNMNEIRIESTSATAQGPMLGPEFIVQWIEEAEGFHDREREKDVWQWEKGQER